MFSPNYSTIIDSLLNQQYDQKQQELNINIKNLNKTLLKNYMAVFPRLTSAHVYIQDFIENVNKLQLLPNRHDYIKLYKENELFELTLELYWQKRLSVHALKFPYIININTITNILNTQRIPPQQISTKNLKRIITKEYFEQFDEDIHAKKEGRDFLDNIKSQNPIIAVCNDTITKTYLVNGNHRVIQSLRNNQAYIEGYILDPSIYTLCGITPDYQKFFSLFKELNTKIHKISWL